MKCLRIDSYINFIQTKAIKGKTRVVYESQSRNADFLPHTGLQQSIGVVFMCILGVAI